MNLENPNRISVNGKDYIINTDFRNWISFCTVFEDYELMDDEKLLLSLRLAYRNFNNKMLFDKKFLDSAIDFFRCNRNRNSHSGRKQYLFDYVEDWEMIVADFQHYYHIDLKTIEYLHWFEFIQKLNSLPETCQFMKVLGYRGADLSKIKDKNERARIAKLKSIYRLQKEDDETEYDNFMRE